MPEEHRPKISGIEAFLITGYIALTDIVGVVLVLLALDDFFILDVLTFPVTQFYFRMKGVSRAGLDVATNLLEAIPYIGALPLRTLGVILVIWTDWHPESKIAQAAQKAAQAVPTKAGAPTIKTPVGGLKKA